MVVADLFFASESRLLCHDSVRRTGRPSGSRRSSTAFSRVSFPSSTASTRKFRKRSVMAFSTERSGILDTWLPIVTLRSVDLRFQRYRDSASSYKQENGKAEAKKAQEAETSVFRASGLHGYRRLVVHPALLLSRVGRCKATSGAYHLSTGDKRGTAQGSWLP
jgi:hypothetical protein